MLRMPSSWRLFWLLALGESAVVCLGLPRANFHSPHGMEPIIVHSVRSALPFFLLAFTASSLFVLWPGTFTRWLLTNRRYFGLAFAFGMAWHLSFVGYSILRFGNGLNRFVTTLDVIGLLFLLALTLTSFRWCSRHLSSPNWRRLHRSGVYAIWLLAIYIYASAVRYQRDGVHLIFACLLLAAWLLRVMAGVKQRSAMS